MTTVDFDAVVRDDPILACVVGARCRGRTAAPCRPSGLWVSAARPPNRTCDFHRIRLST